MKRVKPRLVEGRGSTRVTIVGRVSLGNTTTTIRGGLASSISRFSVEVNSRLLI